MNISIKSSFLLLLLPSILLFSIESAAVDASRLWLPKKYSAAKPKLIAAAKRAEETRRCKKVIKGEMITRKNTADAYYFVLTCRDEQARTYNVSYLYPIAGTEAQLIAEQSNESEKLVVVKSSGVEQEQALTLCKNAVLERASEMRGVKSIDEEIRSEVTKRGLYRYEIPFLAATRLGKNIAHMAHCEVDKSGRVTFSSLLQSAGAVALCNQALLEEPLLLKNIELEDKNTFIEKDEMIDVTIPFSATNLAGDRRQFNAFCSADRQAGVKEIDIEIERDSLYSLCLEALNEASDEMIGVVAHDQLFELTEEYGEFSAYLYFDAKNQSGRALRFQAACEIDDSGRSSVMIEARQ